MKTRLKILTFAFLVLLVGLVARLFYWQISMASELSKEAKLQYQRTGKVLAKRGSILSSDSTWLATDSDAWTLFVMKPELKEDVRTVANKLAPITLQMIEKKEDDSNPLLTEAQRIEGVLSKDGIWFPIAHRVTGDIKKNIDAMHIAGVGFDPEGARVYPEGSSSAQLLGFVGKDDAGNDKGYFGLEGYYDLTLSGKPGFTNRESDARGAPIVFGNSSEVDATQGVDLVTNIDKTVQSIVERELKDGIELYGAKGGVVIVMNPQTGAILSIASSPSFDPTKYWTYTNDDFKNPAISDTFEPGSIFKPIIMASALDARVVEPDTECDICAEPIKIDKYSIETWNGKYHPDTTMTDVIVNSDNTGMVFAGRKLGMEKVYNYLDKFGIGRPTGIDLQGEVSLPLRDKDKWNIVDAATVTFGQGIAVTPIQILRAIGIIANGGEMVKPEVVKEIKKGDWSAQIKPEIGERVISEEAAGKIRDMMVAAIDRGESKWAAPKGFKIAGKTGTAQIPIAGHYDPTKTIASFVGFAPANNPKFVMLVSLREPSSSIWGSETAAPLWFNIARDLFPYLGIQPEN